jgi:hypothetical protein
LGFHIVGF